MLRLTHSMETAYLFGETKKQKQNSFFFRRVVSAEEVLAVTEIPGDGEEGDCH